MHVWNYREHLRGWNRRLAEEYIENNKPHVVSTIGELAKATPVNLAIQQLHQAIRTSPAQNFWPIIRESKGVLLMRSTDKSHDSPWPWRRTSSGNLRYELPGHLLFSPWLLNVRRRVRSRAIELSRLINRIE
jgi:hypothetical protein